MTTPYPDTHRDAALLGGALEADTIANMYLTFDIGSEEYGVAIADVIEIVGIQRIMPIPDLPVYFERRDQPAREGHSAYGYPPCASRMDERAYDDRTVIIVMEGG